MSQLSFLSSRACASAFLISGCIALLAMHTDSAAQTNVVSGATPQVIKVPFKGAGIFGSTLDLSTELFKPDGPGPFPVLIYAHGRSGTQQERSAMREVIPRQYLEYWLAKGFAVVAPARPGYGLTGGMDREIPGHRWENNGNCSGVPNPQHVATVAGAAITATVDWVREQPWADSSKLFLSGNSVGGMTAVSLGANNPAGVVGYINFAGGIAGNPSVSPGKSCAPEKVGEAYAGYGKTTRVSSLWLYAENDLFWGGDIPKAWHAAFAAGGSPTKLVSTPALPNADGHDLIFIGSSLWREPVDAFLKQLGFE